MICITFGVKCTSWCLFWTHNHLQMTYPYVQLTIFYLKSTNSCSLFVLNSGLTIVQLFDLGFSAVEIGIYRCFSTTYRPHSKGSADQENWYHILSQNVVNYQYTRRNIPEELRSYLQCDASLITPNLYVCCNLQYICIIFWWYPLAQQVVVPGYKSEGHSIPDSFIAIFHWHNPTGRTMALALTQKKKKMSTRNISWE
jgi:hypothetical protein